MPSVLGWIGVYKFVLKLSFCFLVMGFVLWIFFLQAGESKVMPSETQGEPVPNKLQNYVSNGIPKHSQSFQDRAICFQICL